MVHQGMKATLEGQSESGDQGTLIEKIFGGKGRIELITLKVKNTLVEFGLMTPHSGDHERVDGAGNSSKSSESVELDDYDIARRRF